MSSPSQSGTSIESLQHQDRRVNIPTEELSSFVADDEKAPRKLLYPRDPSLDPQLVWKGKDEQDSADLAVESVPIYIQEKVHPRVLIENLRNQTRRGKPGAQLDLFADFDGPEDDFEKRVDFYHWSTNWSNRLILGDSLLVMASLAEKEGLKGQVQMIYIDPPYGIKFGSNWQVSTRKRDVRDGKAEDLTRQPEQVRAFRDTWKLGIHSYLAYLRDRLVIARELLTESGSVFVQIGDESIHLVRSLMDEVLGSENFVSLISFRKTSNLTAIYLPSSSDFIIWYAKARASLKYRQLYMEKSFQSVSTDVFGCVDLPDGSWRRLTQEEKLAPASLPQGWKLFGLSDLTSSHYYDSPPFAYRGRSFTPMARYWSTSPVGLSRLAAADRLAVVGETLRYKRAFHDFPVTLLNSQWDDTGTGTQTEERVYVVQTSSKAIQRCVLMTTDPGDLVLDPTCGGGTTACVAEQWGRRWITIDTSRVALALARTRLMAARYPYYLLADSPEGRQKEAEITGQVPLVNGSAGDIKKGFVYKRVPHITLKSIANNEEIDLIHARWQEKLEPIRARLNELLKRRWEEWEVPREPEESWPQEARQRLQEWWELRRARQQEMDASIARHADTETLFDKPYEDPKRIRVTGPFTVESLSPHRVLSPDGDRPQSEAQADQEAVASADFATTIISNLKAAGVQNTRKQERLKLDRLETFPGTWLQAAGEYTDAGGAVKRVAVSIGPEHGTVGPDAIRDAAKEAMKGAGFDLLIVCGLAFDPLAGETAREFAPQSPQPSGQGVVLEATRQYGKLPILLARVNPDLTMGGDLLKKTGSGNLFMVFGEPDVELRRVPGPEGSQQLVVEVRGVDIYDPTTGEIRSSSTDDIACWFIDTDYNGESFFVRHAYFTGGNEPYEKLKRALRAEIDEAAWASLYSTSSRPFDPPSTGKIAVKVINHYGDEVLKVYGVPASTARETRAT